MATIAYLERHHEEKNMHRYYRLTICPTLFGQFALIREWGRVGTRKGQRKEDWYEQQAEAVAAGLKLSRQKQLKGYR